MIIWQLYFFKKQSYYSPQWLYHFKFWPTVQEGSHFSTLSTELTVCRFFYDGYSQWCEITSHCSLICIFLIINDTEGFFPYALWQSVYLLWRNICLVCHFWIGLFVFLVSNCMSCLYILDINCLSIALFAGIFSYSKDYLSVLFFISVSMKKLLSLIRTLLFTVVFIFITLGDGSKHILLQFVPENVLPISSTKILMLSGLIFMSLIYFEFIFVYGFRESSKCIFLHVAVQFPQNHLLKRLSFSHCCLLCLMVTICA